MAQIAVPSTSRNATPRTAAAVFGSLVSIALILQLAGPQRFAWVQTAFIIFGSLLVEAMPFIAGRRVRLGGDRGVRAGGRRSSGWPASRSRSSCRRPRSPGVAFPVCECGSVPVARRLAAKGLAPSAAVTFMLAAPIVNPVVIASTFVAYRGRDTLWTMVPVGSRSACSSRSSWAGWSGRVEGRDC